MIRSKHADKGKVVEKLVQRWLDDRSNARMGFAYHRFPDARSAQGALGKQPADYLVAEGSMDPGQFPRATLLEAKESKELRRLPKDKISQYGKLKMFSAAGVRAIVLVFRSAHNDWVFFTEDQLFNHDVCPPSFPFEGLETFPTHTAALERIFS